MNIQPNTNTNFGANQILIAQKNNRTAVVDIFKLNICEDKPFAHKCYSALCKKHTRDLTSKQKDLKDFFKAFLGEDASQTRNYYLSIKNGETLESGIVAWKCFNIVQTASQRKLFCIQDYVKEALNFGFLSDIKKTYHVKSLNFLEPNGSYKKITGNEIESELKEIQKRLDNVTLEPRNEKVDLNKFLGIDDFETNSNL